jgi:alkylation response protein AidB-like acyl-CoA dehydrogenase
VRVPRKNVVGEVNKGWTVAKRLLQYERTSIGGIGRGNQQAADSLEAMARDYIGVADGRIADANVRRDVLRHRMNDRAFALTLRRSVEDIADGRAPGAESSIFKYYATEQNKGRYELLVNIMGTQGLGWNGSEFSDTERETTRAWLRSRANSIEGGTSEVQLNIIAKRVLGLPD